MEYKIQDGSGDRKYFTLIPNYILNHSTANDQATYIQMKKVAGEDGECFLSERELCDRLGIGKVSLRKSIAYLKKKKWIEFVGQKEVKTKGGRQGVNTYVVNDIWRQNIDHYEAGGSKTAYPNNQGGSETTNEVGLKRPKGGSEVARNKNNTNKNPIIRTQTPAQKMRLFIDTFEKNENYTEVLGGIWEERGKQMTPSQKVAFHRQITLFLSYWTELNKSGTKQRWDQQKTFQVERRLVTWFSRVKDFNRDVIPKMVKI